MTIQEKFDLESIYDEEISPLLARILDIAENTSCRCSLRSFTK